MSIADTLKSRLVKDRPMATVALKIPIDVVESLERIASERGFSNYEALIEAYLGEGLRRDEAGKFG